MRGRMHFDFPEEFCGGMLVMQGEGLCLRAVGAGGIL